MAALAIHVRGVVQGVGFRPFVFRLARRNALNGWVLNAGEGVEIFLEGAETALHAFVEALRREPPEAAVIAGVEVSPAAPAGCDAFRIRESRATGSPTTRIAPDLAVCDDCLRELADPNDRRHGYPYITCTNCGPRYSVVVALPYDRANTTMRDWPLDEPCRREYEDPSDRRFHAEPIACPACGPHHRLINGAATTTGDAESLREAARLLRAGRIVAIKGLGGYHLACDATNAPAVAALRTRKFRKEKPFAIMTRDLDTARSLVDVTPAVEALLTSRAHPIVLAPKRRNDGKPERRTPERQPESGTPKRQPESRTPERKRKDPRSERTEAPGTLAPWHPEDPEDLLVSPLSRELGLMLPYTPVHHLLFAAGAPPVLVMTSANRSSEPIAFRDADAIAALDGIADAFLVGERPIARRVDDSVVRPSASGPILLRRARGYAPGAVAAIPASTPILALGADLKNTVTLVVAGEAVVSQHVGDLEYHDAREAFRQTLDDLLSMYRLRPTDVRIAHDAHPGYASTAAALAWPAGGRVGVQHHRAHVASVLAEVQRWDARVIGFALDGTGFGDDGTIWGGEAFAGSVAEGFTRVAHLRPAALPGGDAAARHPVRAAAGFLAGLPESPDVSAPPFDLGAEYRQAARLLASGLRTWRTTSMGRLFDAAAALLGFARPITFEGQAAMWLEQLAGREDAGGATTRPATATCSCPLPFPFDGRELDWRPLLLGVAEARRRGRSTASIAAAFHGGVAAGLAAAAERLCETHGVDTVVCSGGVCQNVRLMTEFAARLESARLRLWVNHLVPPNDGGISLGQAAIAAFTPGIGRAPAPRPARATAASAV